MKKLEKMLREDRPEAQIRDVMYECIKNGEIGCNEIQKCLDRIDELRKDIKHLEGICAQLSKKQEPEN